MVGRFAISDSTNFYKHGQTELKFTSRFICLLQYDPKYPGLLISGKISRVRLG